MKTSLPAIPGKISNKIVLLFSALIISVLSMAQDKKVDININSKGDDGFFNQPWVWIIGGAVFILLLVALVRSNKK